MMKRLRALFCRHVGGVHLCQPPNGVPSLIVCIKCDVLLSGDERRQG